MLLVKVERFSSQKLETNVMTEQFMGLEEGMNFFEIVVPKIALAHQVYAPDMVVWESEQLITEEDSIWIIMHIEVLYGQVIKFPQTLVS